MGGCSWRRSVRCGCAGRGSCLACRRRSRSSGNPMATSTPASSSTSQPRRCRRCEREAGVDVGIARLATIADHRRRSAPTSRIRSTWAASCASCARLEREKSRRQKGSANRDKTRRKVAIAHNEVARARRDYHHKQALALVRENQVIHVEDLNIVGMVRNRRLARAISRCGVGAVRADHRRESRPLRAHRASGVALVGVEQDLLGVRASARRTAAADPALDVPVMPGGPRPRPQRRQGHSRRRAGGETKRLWSPR